MVFDYIESLALHSKESLGLQPITLECRSGDPVHKES